MKGRKLAKLGALTLAVTGILVGGYATTASAGFPHIAPLTIVKTVEGPVTEGTTFEVTIHCDRDMINPPGGGAPVDEVTLSFGADGKATGDDTVTFSENGTCEVTETATGGAQTVTYSCAGIFPNQQTPSEDICPFGPQSDPMSVDIEVEEQAATVTVANTFPPPPTTPPTTQPAPAPVQVQPTFTG